MGKIDCVQGCFIVDQQADRSITAATAIGVAPLNIISPGTGGIDTPRNADPDSSVCIGKTVSSKSTDIWTIIYITVYGTKAQFIFLDDEFLSKSVAESKYCEKCNERTFHKIQ